MNKKGKKSELFRIIKMIFKEYPVMLPIGIVSILIYSITKAIPALYMQRGIAIVEKYWLAKDWISAKPEITSLAIEILIVFAISLITNVLYTQLMTIISRGFLARLRNLLFEKMEKLPISFFDTNNHGDIMSYYTNDIDTLREFIAQTLPTSIFSLLLLIILVFVMMYLSIWLFLLVVIGVIVMMLITRYIGGNSTKYFRAQQNSMGKTEGVIEEIMNGQKVVKVFNHEEETKEKFDIVNDELFRNAQAAYKFSNVLFPIMGNVGNMLYVATAVIGGAFILFNVPNLSFSGKAMGISIVISFLNMTKQFTGNVAALSNQVNSIAMAKAGAERVFKVIDMQPEIDEGNVDLVYAHYVDGKIEETNIFSGLWAWKMPTKDGKFIYKKLEGNVILKDVNFGYTDEKPILKNINVYANSGQKVAFVGATGAGKTTITNLINRFYEIQSGTITYDGIDIKDIKKSALRKSMGLVLQDTNLFTGTIMENIRYGYLQATDEECIAAAKLAGAHEFITQLPEGYDTVISGNNESLSQGQRQLLSIARAAIADPPVMILDEATSSIDTRTEAIVQYGMDQLMVGRTVFVIAHRLSTIRNSDVIIVLDHGEIIERGSHEQLLAEKGNYYQLYTGVFELE